MSEEARRAAMTNDSVGQTGSLGVADALGSSGLATGYRSGLRKFGVDSP